MSAVNCPMCELRFTNKNERDWHLRNEHEHLHVHRPAERPITWPQHGDPSRSPHPASLGGDVVGDQLEQVLPQDGNGS